MSWVIGVILLLVILWDVSLLSYCRDVGRLNRLLSEDTLERIRGQEISLEALEKFRKWDQTKSKGSSGLSAYDYLCVFLMTGEEGKSRLERYSKQLMNYRDDSYEELTGYVTSVWEDLQYFPVPESTVNEEALVSFEDSWMSPRSFGGKRGHEGTDVMAAINERGRYPVVSMTDGVVEKIGWLTKGGYRIGIRGPHGGYFYYAHLSDYAREFALGDTVEAGELLGFMGDTGYSEIEGTVGNFDVHLHVGIYVNKPDGVEMSVNAFWPLKSLEKKKLRYPFY